MGKSLQDNPNIKEYNLETNDETNRSTVSFKTDGTPTVSVTFDNQNPESSENLLIVSNGTPGGTSEPFYKRVNTDSRNGNIEYTTVTYSATSGAGERDELAHQAVNELMGVSNNQVTQVSTGGEVQQESAHFNKIVVCGTSAGAGPEPVTATINEFKDSADQMDVMLFDAYGGNTSSEYFAETSNAFQNNYHGISDVIREKEGVVYCYASTTNGKDGQMLKNMKGAVTDPETPVPVVAVKNPKNIAHASTIDKSTGKPYNYNCVSPEEELAHGEAQRVMNRDFTQGHDEYSEENKYHFYSPTEDTWVEMPKEYVGLYGAAFYNDKVEAFESAVKSGGRFEKIGISNLRPDGTMRSPYTGEKGTSSQARAEKPIDIKYSSAIFNTNGIISSLNSTEIAGQIFANPSFFSTSAFPASAGVANSFFCATSGALLEHIAHDTKNIEQILVNATLVDKDLANDAALINGDGFSNDDSYKVELSNAYIEQMKKINSGNIFNLVTQGNAGRVDMADLNGLLSGSIGSTLRCEIEDANNLKDSISALRNDPNISSPSWDKMLERLDKYSEYCDLRIKAAETLEGAYQEATNLISNYISPDASMDDGEIPQYEETIELLKRDIQEMHTRISNLRREIANLSNVRPTPIYEQDSKGNYYFAGYDYSAYNAAQAQIQVNNTIIHDINNQIASAEEAKEEATIYLHRLRGLAAVMNQANQIVNDALSQVNDSYASAVNSVVDVTVQAYA